MTSWIYKPQHGPTHQVQAVVNAIWVVYVVDNVCLYKSEVESPIWKWHSWYDFSKIEDLWQYDQNLRSLYWNCSLYFLLSSRVPLYHGFPGRNLEQVQTRQRIWEINDNDESCTASINKCGMCIIVSNREFHTFVPWDVVVTLLPDDRIFDDLMWICKYQVLVIYFDVYSWLDLSIVRTFQAVHQNVCKFSWVKLREISGLQIEIADDLFSLLSVVWFNQVSKS